MNKRSAIYARVSTDLQRNNYSIPSQVAECAAFAATQGYTVVGNHFVDRETGLDSTQGNGSLPAFVDDYSSREMSRPGLDRALDYLERVGYDVLIVHSLDRLARDPYIRQTLEREFEARGARVQYVLGSYEETPEGEVRKDLDATFAKWENAKRVERTNRGKLRKAESGQFVTGKTHYGYIRDESAPGGLGVNEQEAAVVRRIFEMYVDEGLSIYEIIDRLHREGVPSWGGGRKWAKTSINRMLRNPLYVGRYYYNRTRYTKDQRVVPRDKSEWIEIPTTPIVSEGLFVAAQKRFQENKERRRRMPHRFYLLSGMVVCSQCQRPYVATAYPVGKQRRARDGRRYRHRMKNGHCTNKTVQADPLECRVWGEIVTLLKDPQQLRRGYEASMQQQAASAGRARQHQQTIHKQLAKLDQMLTNLNAAYIDPEIPLTRKEYLVQKARIEAEQKTLQGELEALDADLAAVPTQAALETLEAFSEAIRSRLATGEIADSEKRKILQLLHVTVVLGLDGQVRLDGWFTSPANGGLSDRESPFWVILRRYRPPLPR